MGLKELFNLYFVWFKMGLFTFGGGYAMLPMIQREVVEKYHWASEDEIMDYYAIGQCTPGIIAVNTATFVGFRQRGNSGGIIATLGVVFPSIVIIMIIAAFLQNFADIPAVNHAFAGVRACVCALIASSVLQLRKSTVVDKPTLLIFLVIFLLSIFSGSITAAVPALSFLVSPVVLVVVAGVCGLSIKAAGRWKS